MLPNPFLYYSVLALCGVALAWRCFVHDRLLGWIVVGALVVNVVGATFIGTWTQRMHGRSFFAGDEVAYQWEGSRLLRSWQTGFPFVRATVGAYAPMNAVVIAWAGPGHRPMRVATAVVGAIGVAATYWLAHLVFRDLLIARLSALFAALSPILILYSWANIRDRWIGATAVLALVAVSLLLQRFSWLRLVGLAAALLVLGELRHYWAALIGWLSIPGYALFATLPLNKRLVNTIVLVLVVGAALWVPTGSFLAYSMRGETAVRYVSVSPSDAATSPSVRPRSAHPGGAGAAATAADPAAGTPADPANPAMGDPGVDDLPPYSGPTLGLPVPARPQSLSEFLGNAQFVLFGRLHPRPDGGRFASKVLLPEALGAYLLFPLALAGFILALRRGYYSAFIPAAYVGAMILLLSWLRGDDWNTYRFRGLYWSVLLMFAAAGVVWCYEVFIQRRRATTRLSPEASV